MLLMTSCNDHFQHPFLLRELKKDESGQLNGIGASTLIEDAQAAFGKRFNSRDSRIGP